MPGKLSLALALLALISTAQAHSLEKRQTTVKESLGGLLRASGLHSVSRTIAGIDLGTVAVLVLGFILLDVIFTLLLAGAVGGRSSSGGWFSSWGVADLTGYVSSVYNSIDLVDTAFNYMDIEEESCRLKTVCEMEAYAVAHPLAKLAINTINSNLRGLDRYQDAIDAGMNGQDCAFLYDQCQFSYFGY